MTSINSLQSLQSNDLLKITTVSEVMQTVVIHASPSSDLLSIAQIIASENVDSVVIAQERIVGAGEAVFPVGIIAERDIKLLQTLKLDLADIQAETVMNSSLFCVRSTDSLLHAFNEMQCRNLQQLVVVGDRKELVGNVTLTSCLQLECGVKKNTQ